MNCETIKTTNKFKQGFKTGQSTLEILIALAILIISVSATIVVLFGGQSISVDTKLNQEAIAMARQSLENARANARQNFDALADSSSTIGEFLKETIVTAIDPDTKQIISRVTWQTDPLRPQKVEFTTIVTDWRNVFPPADPADSGGGGLTGNWCNPQTLGSVDLGPGNSATDLDVINKIAFISAEASAAAKPDFFVIDATNGQSPVVAASINTGPSLNSLDVSGSFAYAANNSSTAQLQIINVSNIAAPVLISSFTLPGVSGTGAKGNSIFYANDKVYIGTKTASGPEFHVVDVSNPNNPVTLGSKEIGRDINDIFVYNNIAYIANSHSNEIKALDVSDPANINEIASYDPNGASAGKSVFVAGTKAYLGRLAVNPGNEFYVLDASSSSTIASLGSKEISSDINDISVRDNFAFLATSDSNKEFQVWNVTDPANMTSCTNFNFPQVATGIDYENNIVYVSVRSNDALRIITSQ